MRLAGRNVLVTGAGSGIGCAIAILFAREGARVAAADIDLARVEETCREVKRDGGDATPILVDVRDQPAVAEMVDACARRFDILHVLVNNAGVAPRAMLEHLSEDAWAAALETNLLGAVRCTRASLDLLKAARGASVINIASVMLGHYQRKLSAYSASKGGLASLSRSLALELAPHGIRVNYISPGFIRSEMTRRYWSRWWFRKYMERRTPLGRFGEPEDVARAALFLASAESEFITGSGLTVDGGLTLGLIW